jgi:two-component system, cell cycle response regulator
MGHAMSPSEPRGAFAVAANLEDSQRLDTLQPCRVLIVDDDDLVRARLSAVLKSSRYEVEVAASGEEALRVMNAKHCHIVLTDWEMPDMDGLALCRCVRVSQEEGYVYVLMLTVRNSKEDVVAGLAAGADDYIVKGAPIAELLARLEVGRRIVHVERSLRVKPQNRHLSLTDSVSGAHNLRYFAIQLSRELSRSQRYGHPLAVLDCRIDEFSRIRDQFGHEAAAEILRIFVTRVESCIRASSDWVARVGAGEFMIVLPETPPYGASRVVEKLYELFAAEVVTTISGPVGLVASFATIAADPNKRPESAARIEELIRSAHGDVHAKSAIAERPMGDESAARSERSLLGRGRGGMN